MDVIGAEVARRAIRERRNILMEIVGCNVGTVALIDSLTALGYQIEDKAVLHEFSESVEWNLRRSDTNISAYFAEPFHLKWMMAACREAEQSRYLGLRA